MRNHERSVYSQRGQDGINDFLIRQSFSDPRNHYFVEIGTENGIQCNTRYLREYYNWNGLLIDGCHENQKINLHKHFITAENVVSILQNYEVPKSFEFLSLDIDFNTFYVLKKILNYFRPSIIDVEYNSAHGPFEDKVVIYNNYFMWDNTNYYGGSLLSFYKMLNQHEYSLVYAESSGTDAFFVSNEVVKNNNLHFENMNDVAKIYCRPIFLHKQDHLERRYLTADQACFYIGENLYAN